MREVLRSLRFSILGPLEITAAGAGVPMASPRQKAVLSMLLAEPNRVVGVERLIDAVWGGFPPATARGQIQICISAIRGLLAKAGFDGIVLTRPPGYLLRCTEEEHDLLSFERLVRQARQASSRDRAEEAASLYNTALALWRDDPFLDVTSELVRTTTIRLCERRLAVAEEYAEVRLRLGGHPELVSDLTKFVAANPFRERMHALLALALHRAGRRADALQACRTARKLFIEELGLEPGAELASAERAILTGDDDPPATAASAPAEPAIAHLLPIGLSEITGRAEQVRRIRDLLAAPLPAAVRIVVVTGAAGHGKTTLAIHAGHSLAEAFPGGQLYACLGGSTQHPVSPAAILERFLLALGVARESLPAELETRAELFRHWVSLRRVLIVLDDAADERQVTALLPGCPTAAVLITSRARLTGLPGARQLEIGPLAAPDAVDLLGTVLGTRRVKAEREAAYRIAELCDRVPLALAVAAARLAAHPHWTLSTLASRLADEDTRITELAHGEQDIGSAIASMYDPLSPKAKLLLHRICLFGSPVVEHWICAALLDGDEFTAERAVDELVTAALLDVDGTPGGIVLFRLSRLHQAFLRGRLEKSTVSQDRHAAHRKVCEARRRLGRADRPTGHGPRSCPSLR